MNQGEGFHRRCSLCGGFDHNRQTCKHRGTSPKAIVPACDAAVVVYALVDPRRPEVYRFIGKSRRGIAEAHKHARDARAGALTPCARWIRDLLLVGVGCKVVVLEETTLGKVDACLRRWLKKHCHDVLNASRNVKKTRAQFSRGVSANRGQK